jgi:hypothetical protein
MWALVPWIGLSWLHHFGESYFVAKLDLVTWKHLTHIALQPHRHLSKTHDHYTGPLQASYRDLTEIDDYKKVEDEERYYDRYDRDVVAHETNSGVSEKASTLMVLGMPSLININAAYSFHITPSKFQVFTLSEPAASPVFAPNLEHLILVSHTFNRSGLKTYTLNALIDEFIVPMIHSRWKKRGPGGAASLRAFYSTQNVVSHETEEQLRAMENEGLELGISKCKDLDRE